MAEGVASFRESRLNESMHISVVYDNRSEVKGIRSGWGFSCLVGERLLFDTGEKFRPLRTNMARLGGDLHRIDAVVISHDHWDHTGGLWKLLKTRHGIPVYGCPGFGPRFFRQVEREGGRPMVVTPGMEIVPGVFTTGEVAGSYKGIPMPEQAIMIDAETGLTVITGCSHPGIVAMAEAAQACFPGRSLRLVLGGFHLSDQTPEAVRVVAEKLKSMGVERIAPTHCTGDRAVSVFQEIFGERFVPVAAGTRLETGRGDHRF